MNDIELKRIRYIEFPIHLLRYSRTDFFLRFFLFSGEKRLSANNAL